MAKNKKGLMHYAIGDALHSPNETLGFPNCF